MELPVALLNQLNSTKGFNRPAFEQAHLLPEQVTSIRFNPAKLQQRFHSFLQPNYKVPWSSWGYYLEKRPSFIFDPLWHAGLYYVQEASSMFLEEALKQCIDVTQPLMVLDLCAAPGGKATLLQSSINKNSVLVANEVIKTRASILVENITKWGGDNVVITNNDPSHFAQLPNFFDVVVVDAPCSGSGLFRRDADAIAEWSEGNVQLCSQRQQRILNDVWPCLKEDGVLIYSTCSYSSEEDEAIIEWVINNKKATIIELTAPAQWSLIASNGGFRFYPDKLKGEGFFIGAIRKNSSNTKANFKSKKNALEKPSKEELAGAIKWMKQGADDGVLVKKNDSMIFTSRATESILPVLQNSLYIKKAGIAMGKWMKKDMIPSHEWALGGILSNEIPVVELTLEQAISYLQRSNFSLPYNEKGWFVVQYEQYPLGWIKLVGNRMNNYYPLNWRILTQNPNKIES